MAQTGTERLLEAVLSGFDTYYKRLGLTKAERARKVEEGFREQEVGIKQGEAASAKKYGEDKLTLDRDELEAKINAGYFKHPPSGSGDKTKITADELMLQMELDYRQISRMLTGSGTTVDTFNKVLTNYGLPKVSENEFKQLQGGGKLFEDFLRTNIAENNLISFPDYAARINAWISGYGFEPEQAPEPKPERTGLFTSMFEGDPKFPPAGEGNPLSGGGIVGGLPKGTAAHQNKPIDILAPGGGDYGVATKTDQMTGPGAAPGQGAGRNLVDRMASGAKKIGGIFQGAKGVAAGKAVKVFVNRSLYLVYPDGTVKNSAGQPVTDPGLLDDIAMEQEKQKKPMNITPGS